MDKLAGPSRNLLPRCNSRYTLASTKRPSLDGGHLMSDPATIAREYLEGWNRRDWALWSELLHPDYTYTGGDGQLQKGPQAGMDIGQMFATAFPDGKLEIRRIHTASDNVA